MRIKITGDRLNGKNVRGNSTDLKQHY